MDRRAVALGIALVFCLLAGMAVHADPLAQQPQVQITSPEMGAEVRGVVPIMGSASVPSFQFYKVEFGVGPNPAQWAVIGELHQQPVINGQLAVWDTRVLPDGVYTLRLQAVKMDGNWEEFLVRQIAIVNTRPTSTPTTDATATPDRPTVTPTAEATPTPEVTPTLMIIAPTAALEQPTPTPTLSRPVQQRDLPVNPDNWLQSFIYGGIAMGTIFVLMGIVFAVRRLL